jgi:hypothetical protein
MTVPAEGVLSATLVQGYAVEGKKWCWGNLVPYPDRDLYRCVDDAKHGVENQRERGQGVWWTITSVPAVLARGTSSALVLCVSRRWKPLLALRAGSPPRLCDLLPQPESSRPYVIVKLPDSRWKPCERPFPVWTAESASGSSPLIWKESVDRSYYDLAPGTDEWVRTLEMVVGSARPEG